jgi:putative transcriptional regulator
MASEGAAPAAQQVAQTQKVAAPARQRQAKLPAVAESAPQWDTKLAQGAAPAAQRETATPSDTPPAQPRDTRTPEGAAPAAPIATASSGPSSGKRQAAVPVAEGFLTGQLLVAMPAMSDPRFAQSVIYVCAHTADGAMGLVVNRPIVKPSFDELLRQLEVAPVPPMRRIRLCAGGPVENGRGFVLHTVDWTGEGSLRVNEALALTASLDVLKAIAGGGGPREGLLALGYAGWGPGQLDSEIQQNAWLSVPAQEPLLFDAGHDTKWHRALASLHIDPLLLSSAAGHA